MYVKLIGYATFGIGSMSFVRNVPKAVDDEMGKLLLSKTYPHEADDGNNAVTTEESLFEQVESDSEEHSPVVLKAATGAANTGKKTVMVFGKKASEGKKVVVKAAESPDLTASDLAKGSTTESGDATVI